MSAYFDSGVIAKWYVPEHGSAAVHALRKKFRPPAVLTHLHRIELVAAFHLKVFRKEMPLAIATQAVADLQTDVDAGIWSTPSYDLAAVHARAEHLASRYAAKLGTRTLDILHVAAALELGEKRFVTSDVRQARLAAAVGLRVTAL